MDAWLLPPDLWLFLASVAGLFIVGIPAIRANVKIPAELEIEVIPEESLAPVQASFLDGHDRELVTLGYVPAATFQVPNLGSRNVSRLYLDSRGSGVAVASALTSLTGEVLPQNYLELIQDFTDGTTLTTRNTTVSAVLPGLPRQVLQERPAHRTARALKAAHDRGIERLGKLPAPPVDAAEVFCVNADRHRAWCAYLEKRGFLTRDGAAGPYRATARAGLRGIRNFLNPFADGFRLHRFLAGALVSTALPVVGHRLNTAGGAALLPEWALFLPLFVAAGAAVGALFDAKHFLWCFLLGYLPARTLGGLGLEAILYLGVMSEAARNTSRMLLRRRIVA